MAAWVDVRKRLERLQAAYDGTVESTYRGAAPKWFLDAVVGCGGLHVVNVKGRNVDNAIVLLTLGELERLLAGRQQTP
jgi:hypothetical protein